MAGTLPRSTSPRCSKNSSGLCGSNRSTTFESSATDWSSTRAFAAVIRSAPVYSFTSVAPGEATILKIGRSTESPRTLFAHSRIYYNSADVPDVRKKEVTKECRIWPRFRMSGNRTDRRARCLCSRRKNNIAGAARKTSASLPQGSERKPPLTAQSTPEWLTQTRTYPPAE